MEAVTGQLWYHASIDRAQACWHSLAAMDLPANKQSLDALALEYQGDYGTACGDLNIFDLMNNPTASGKCSVFGLSLTEKGLDFPVPKFGAVFDDRTNALLIRKD